MVAIKKGEVVDKLVGIYDEDAVTSLINKLKDSNMTGNMTSRHETATSQERHAGAGLLAIDKAIAMSYEKTVVILYTAKWCQPCKVLMSWIESSPHIADDKVGQYS